MQITSSFETRLPTISTPSEVTSSMSLEKRMIQAYADASVSFENERRGITELLGGKLDPATALSLQVKTADYNLGVSLISALARKVTGAVETLLRS
ncbi:hypothetical protein PTE30175_01242 [Pandoraea terrae]|uniref:Uncharacterized protein n=1 Tax=Pandoraea terrae TaxID=1537710 RepID=A0A5E4TDY1_9BURK|nr:type III secretion system inner rod subunit SctI [Pandoraea terrae]VVD84748.1 hypothetical protein PTE30175_01242 [Pandoraea terrae]